MTKISKQYTLDHNNYRVVASTTERDAILTEERFELLKVGVVADGNTYALIGGVTNSDWVAEASTTYTFQYSIVDSSSVVNLSGDVASPGNSKLYGTNSSGTRGWYDIPTSGTPDAHVSTHEDGGGDEMSVAGLSGLLGDAQTPVAHDLVSAYHTASGLTTGHLLQALTATTFGFATIPSHNHAWLDITSGVPTDITDLTLYDTGDLSEGTNLYYTEVRVSANSDVSTNTNVRHNRIHGLTSADHTVSGLTTGHFLKALSATTFGFAVHGLIYSDVGAAAVSHSHVIADITDFTDNSTNWNTAYGWGDHDGLYDTSGTASGLISTHESTYNHTNYNTAYSHTLLTDNPHAVTYTQLGGTQPEIYWTRGAVLDTKTAGDVVRIGQTAGGYLDFTGYVDIRDDGTKRITIGYPESRSISIGGLAAENQTSDNVGITAIGYQALRYIGDGISDYVLAIGDYALRNTRGNYQLGIGTYAGYDITSGHHNAIVGAFSFRYAAPGATYNTSLGGFSGHKNYGTSNTFIGYMAGASYEAATPSDNTASYNLGIGFYSLYGLTTGGYNFAAGHEAGRKVSTGTGNFFAGYKAGYNVETTNYNTIIGYNMTALITDVYSIKIGVSNRNVIIGNSLTGSEWMGTPYQMRTNTLTEYTVDNGISVDADLETTTGHNIFSNGCIAVTGAYSAPSSMALVTYYSATYGGRMFTYNGSTYDKTLFGVWNATAGAASINMMADGTIGILTQNGTSQFSVHGTFDTDDTVTFSGITADETETYLVAIDDSTGLLSKRLASGVGGAGYTGWELKVNSEGTGYNVADSSFVNFIEGNGNITISRTNGAVTLTTLNTNTLYTAEANNALVLTGTEFALTIDSGTLEFDSTHSYQLNIKTGGVSAAMLDTTYQTPQTTLSGYGITDAYTSTYINNNFDDYTDWDFGVDLETPVAIASGNGITLKSGTDITLSSVGSEVTFNYTGSGGTDYSGGDGIDVTGSVIKVDLDASPGLDFTAGGLMSVMWGTDDDANTGYVSRSSHGHAVSTAGAAGFLSALTGSPGHFLNNLGQWSTPPNDDTNYWTRDSGNGYVYPETIGDWVGIGTNAPNKALHIYGVSADDIAQLDVGLDFHGTTRPSSFTGVVETGSGLEIGLYRYLVSYVTAIGESRTYLMITTMQTTSGNQQVKLTIPISSDYRVTGRRIYRTHVGDAYYKDHLLTTVNNNTATEYIDTTPDASLTDPDGAGYYRDDTTNQLITVNGEAAMLIGAGVTSVGLYAGQNITGGGRLAIFGSYAGDAITTGRESSIFGYGAGSDMTEGIQNSFFGTNAGANVTKGDGNTAMGYDALYYNAEGGGNTAIGHYSLGGVSGTRIDYNTALGHSAGRYVEGARNVVVGYRAFYGVSGSADGDYNTIIGPYAAEFLTSGSYNTVIGHDIDPLSLTGDYQLAIGMDGTKLITGSGAAGSEFVRLPFELQVNNIIEDTSNSGVTIEGTLLKDGYVDFIDSKQEPLALDTSDTVTWNLSTSYNATMAISGNVSLSISNTDANEGDTGNLVITCAASSYTITLPSGSRQQDGATTTFNTSAGTSKRDILSFLRIGTTYYWNYTKGY